MKAEDTVMDNNQIHDAWCSFNGENITDREHNIMKVREGHKAIAKAQAKISFPLGMEEEARGGTNAISYLKGYQDSKKAGIKEVVEHLNNRYHYKPLSGIFTGGIFIPDCDAGWQAKLKEWGIEKV